jgi:hypothetical protein
MGAMTARFFISTLPSCMGLRRWGNLTAELLVAREKANGKQYVFRMSMKSNTYKGKSQAK